MLERPIHFEKFSFRPFHQLNVVALSGILVGESNGYGLEYRILE